jgi:hypothetical protein|tara:strand:+ start:2036 stop:2812 length:777 start_codon:yes stop_codon:yes gene_type:complete
MLWFKKKKEVLDTTPTPADEIDVEVVQPNNNLNALTLRRNILDWRDKHITNIELHLRREISTLMQAIDHELNKLSVIESTFKTKNIHTTIIQPLITDWTKRESGQLLDEAQKELLSIHGLVLEQIEHDANIGEHDSNAHFVDAAKAASVGISGIVAIPAFASASAVSTTGVLGLFGVTAVSLPIAVTGILVIGSLLALSGFKMSTIKEKAIKRYRDQLYSSINASVLGDGNNGKPNLSEQLQIRILTASNFITEEITQ